MDNKQLGTSIAVMNAKGGVGKSTVTLALAETLSYYYGKKVLVIDSDAQMSISVMLMSIDKLNHKRANWETLVGLLHKSLILGEKPEWKEFVAEGVSDVDDTDTVSLLPGDLRLTLVERAVTEADRHEQMRGLVRSLLADARLFYDLILIDCPPGLSLLTEIWLREADYHLAPVKPDFLAIAGLEMFREFRTINPDMKMAETLGILVNMKNANSPEDERYHQMLANDEASRCFPHPVPHMAPIQHAARFYEEKRSFAAKYPGNAGEAFRSAAHEILTRIGDSQQPNTEAVPQRRAGAAVVGAELGLMDAPEQVVAAPAPAPEVAPEAPASAPEPSAAAPVQLEESSILDASQYEPQPAVERRADAPAEADPFTGEQMLPETVAAGAAGIAARFAPDDEPAVAPAPAPAPASTPARAPAAAPAAIPEE